MKDKKLVLGKLQDVSLNETAKAEEREERTVKLQLLVTEKAKRQLDLIKVTDNRKYKDILAEIVEEAVDRMAEEKGISINGNQIAIAGKKE